MPGWFVRPSIVIVPVDLTISFTTPVATIVCSFLNKISILSPFFKLDLSMSLVNKIIFEPLIFSTWNLDDVL